MNHKLLITSLFSLTFLILDNFLLCSCYDFLTVCSNKYRCGTIEADFPFIGGDRPDGCGYPGLKLSCEKDKTTINIKDVKYQVSDLNQEAQTLRIARADFMDGICSPRYRNTSLDTELFDYLLGSTDITLVYGCPSDVNFLVPNGFKCSRERGFVLLGNPGSNGGGVCRSVVNARVEMSDADFSEDIFNVSALEKALREGFGVKYKVDIQGCEDCKKSGGVCGYDINLSQTTCYCANRLSVSGVKTCNTSTTATESGSQMETPENESGTGLSN